MTSSKLSPWLMMIRNYRFVICRPSFPRFSVFRFSGFPRFSVFRFSGFPVFRFFFSAAFRLSADKGKRWRDAVASIWVGLVDTPTLQVSFLYFVFHNTIPLWWMRWTWMWWRLDVDIDVDTWMWWRLDVDIDVDTDVATLRCEFFFMSVFSWAFSNVTLASLDARAEHGLKYNQA